MSGLAFQNVSKRFGDFTAVDDVNLSVPHGTFVCLLGPSGCGKTTLLRMIAGLEEPSVGSIMLDGSDITRVPTHKRNLGMVFQSLALFPHLDVGENIAYPLRIRGAPRAERTKRVEELLSLIHLPDFASRPVARLSGGQKQRVAIARALAMEPDIMLFDEPTSALDPELTGEVLRTMRELAEEHMTMLVVTHEMAFAREVASRVVFMDGGEILESRPSSELFAAPEHPRTRAFLENML
jgi:putative spermidine/putrescine transport system ATP-binding protein